jgi:hypothetical protein
MINLDGIEDAAAIGGVLGFAEESIREEEDSNKMIDQDFDIEVDPRDITDLDLKIFYNTNPDLFNHVASIVRRQTIEWREAVSKKREEEEIELALKEIKEEVDMDANHNG